MHEDLIPFLDEARDWVNLNHPELEGNEYDEAVKNAAHDIFNNAFDYFED